MKSVNCSCWVQRWAELYADKVPGRFTFRADFPRTALGKVRKFILK